MRSTTAAVSSPRTAACLDSERRASLPVSHVSTVAASTSAIRRISPAAGRIHQTSHTVADADEQRDHERWDHPQQQVLQRIDVVNEARQQISAAEGRQPGGRERLESLVRPDT